MHLSSEPSIFFNSIKNKVRKQKQLYIGLINETSNNCLRLISDDV